MSLNDTPRADRLHIGIYGKRNSGKSSLINALTGHETSIVSPVAGTTTDPVYKSMEIYGLGPCVLIDTAGFDDMNRVGKKRVEKTREAMEKTDIAIVVFDPREPVDEEKEWINAFNEKNIPVIAVLNKSDTMDNMKDVSAHIYNEVNILPIEISAKYKKSIDKIISELIKNMPDDYDVQTITGGIVRDGDMVLLVMPQDIQAPKGRLILPQVQTIRELLDKRCIVTSVTADKLEEGLRALNRSPDVIITDSQVFKSVYEKKPRESKLTSFSVLFAAYKGDIDYYTKSAEVLGSLNDNSRVLIAEACTHAPLQEDIGREKLPRMLRKRFGEGIEIDIVSGPDFPEDISVYDIIIQCGACMFNRRHVMSRIERAVRSNVPMTNYGVAIAYLSGILDKISLT